MHTVTHRLFVALNFDEATKNLLSNYAATLKPFFQECSPTWVNPDIYHLTLYFFGEVSEAGFDVIRRQFQSFEHNLQSPALVSQGQRFLPNRKNPRTLCVSFGIEPPALRKSIDSIVAESRRTAATVGLLPDFRPWTPHLTLARFKYVSSRSGLTNAASLASEKATQFEAVPHISCRPKTFDLMESELLPNGPRYTLVRAYSFASTDSIAMPPD